VGRFVIGMVAATLLVSAGARAAPPECPTPAAPGGELAPWTQPGGVERDSDGSQTLAVGRASDLVLSPTAKVRYLRTPEKPGAADRFGGLAGFSVSEGGAYRIALSEAAWIDVIRDGKVVAFTAHGHGPACTGIRKIVDFSLTPGRHVMQLSGSAGDQVRVLIAKIP
jgi:hypothetical protein